MGRPLSFWENMTELFPQMERQLKWHVHDIAVSSLLHCCPNSLFHASRGISIVTQQALYSFWLMNISEQQRVRRGFWPRKYFDCLRNSNAIAQHHNFRTQNGSENMFWLLPHNKPVPWFGLLIGQRWSVIYIMWIESKGNQGNHFLNQNMYVMTEILSFKICSLSWIGLN